MDVVLERALDRCDCPRCRSLAGQIDALIPTPGHIAAYVAMGAALALTAVFAAASQGWALARLAGLALLVATVWFLCLMGAMAWAGARITQADPLAWRSPVGSRWPGWTWVNGGLWLLFVAVQLVTGAPWWLLLLVPPVLGVTLVLSRRRERRAAAGCVRDRSG